MDMLAEYLDGPYAPVDIDLRNKRWHIRGGIPNEPGWYYIVTNTPIAVLRRQTLWRKTYPTKKDRNAKVKNYDIQTRANRYTPNLRALWNVKEVYSGFAASLQSRAREHTFAHEGTGGLALSRYPDLRKYQWAFHYMTLAGFMRKCPCKDMVLHLGEQLWRAKHGWPVLCAN